MAVPWSWRRATDLGLDPFRVIDIDEMSVIQVDETVLLA